LRTTPTSACAREEVRHARTNASTSAGGIDEDEFHSRKPPPLLKLAFRTLSGLPWVVLFCFDQTGALRP
jgi:hypothetical protein